MNAKADTSKTSITAPRKPDKATKPDPAKKKPEEEQKPKKKRRGYWLAALGVLLGMAGVVGTRLGQLWPHFDVISQFTVQIILFTLAFCLALVMPKFRGLAGIVFFMIFVIGYGMWPFIVSEYGPTDAASPEAGEKQLRIASYNTHAENTDTAAQTATIKKMNADLVVLLEFTRAKKPILDELRQQYPYMIECTADEHCKMAIISKLPLQDPAWRTNWEGAPYIRASLGSEFGSTTIFGVHTIRFPYSRAQLRQVRALVKELESVTSRIIMVGDFNATPYSRITQTLSSGTGLTRHTNLPSWPAWISVPQLAIDHIFASPGIRPLSRQALGDAGGSDHFPVAMTFAIPGK